MENITNDFESTDLKTVVTRSADIDNPITVFTLHKEYYGLNEYEKIGVLKGLLDWVVSALGRINSSSQ
jgi:hypothetical protein